MISIKINRLESVFICDTFSQDLITLSFHNLSGVSKRSYLSQKFALQVAIVTNISEVITLPQGSPSSSDNRL